MTDRAELRRLAEAAKGWPWEHKHNAELIAIGDGMYLQIGKINDIEAAICDGKFIAAASPDVVLGLLDVIDAQEQAAIAIEEIIHKLGEERDQYRAVLEAIANHNPAVTHGWAEQVRVMARRALGGEPITDYRAVAVRLKGALEKLARLENGDRPGTSRGNVIAQQALADPEVQAI